MQCWGWSYTLLRTSIHTSYVSPGHTHIIDWQGVGLSGYTRLTLAWGRGTKSFVHRYTTRVSWTMARRARALQFLRSFFETSSLNPASADQPEMCQTPCLASPMQLLGSII